MSAPKSMGDRQLISEDFLSPQTTSDNGWEIKGTPTIDNGLDSTTTGGVSRGDQEMVNWFNNGGTLKIRLNLASGAAAGYGRALIWGTSASNGISLMAQQSNGDVACRIVQGGSSKVVNLDDDLTAGVSVDFVIVWNPVAGTATSYANSVLQTSAATAVTVSDTSGEVHVGHSGTGAGSFKGTTGCLEVDSEQWTQEEVTDDYNKDTYPEIDASKWQEYLPLRTHYNDGTNEVTENIGTSGTNPVLEAGTRMPTQLFPHGLSFDTTDLLTGSVDASSTKNWTVFLGHNGDDIPTVVTHYLFRLGAFATDGFLLNQLGEQLWLYWSSAGAVKTQADFFEEGIHSVCVTSNEGVVSFWYDGERKGADTDLSATAALDGTYPTLYGFGGATSLEGDLYKPRVGFFHATPRQIRYMHEEFLKTLNV